MTARTSRRTLLGGAGASLLAALAGCSGSTPLVGRRIESNETISPDGAERLEVTGDVGEITVVGVGRDDVGLDIVKQSSSIRTDLDDLEFRTERDDDTLELRSEYDGSVGWFESQPTMDLDIEMPEALALERIDASIGRISVRDVTGDLTVETSTGEIDVSSVAGTVGARASTGDVEIREIDALGDVRTSTGRIEVDVPAIDGDTTVEASTGEIAAAIDPDLDADLHVSTSVGEVSVDGLELTDETREDNLVMGTLGDGGPTLRLETSTGRIDVTSLS
ncbi:DUF4097 family beta strand repeat protein [Natronorubrum sp. JWXQ-INN-674]|uniref:DUF4097 family beta strand repeat protein n=1 Tax=Natronorubrum halalkaliphilum TaxID=2691917 RepID=A0A6B0VIL4_9EURY|nr:DUF4097 family beta strand repeat-containing protein [Natronorubrum halalkaliphilum]MXV61390.1 DUF4097 family beta strand repeat protein [Natronorubrum halalkaliphilum]